MEETRKFNNYFLLFTTFIFFAAVYWLYQKHNVGNDSTISEWFINYEGGFTRRGIIGQICFELADFFELRLRFVIFVFQSITYFVYMFLIYRLIKNLPQNISTIVAIYSPLFLLYPLGEIEVLARKEIFLFIGFVIFLYVSSIEKNKNNSLIYIFLIFPILCLIWEPFVFFSSFSIFIILIRFREDLTINILRKITLAFSSTFVISLYIVLNLLTLEEHAVMAEALKNSFGEVCYMSCGLLGTKISIKAQYTGVLNLFSFKVFFRYFLMMLIGYFPLLVLYYNSTLKNKIIFFQRFNNLLIPFFIILLPSLLLFAFMTDWGRVVNMTYTFSILTYLYLLKNDLIILNKKILLFDNLYKHKKRLFIFIFFIFAFFWNPKTQMRGDVATNTLYKIIYNSSKRIIGFEGIYLFKDSAIMKFHKNYIE